MSKISRGFAIAVCVPLGALILAGPAGAQMNSIYKFKGVNVPVSVKSGDKVLAKGTYDLEFVRSQSAKLYFLRILKGGKILGTFQGEEWPYSVSMADLARGSEVPKKPTLKMSLNRADKLLALVFESGMHTVNYPQLRAKFALPFEE